MQQHSIEAVMGRLEPHLDDLDAIARGGHHMYRTDYPEHVRIEHDARAQANCIYAHIVAAAERKFLDNCDVEPLVIRGLKLWLIGGHTAIRFKKMDEHGWTRRYPTQQAQNFDRMLPLEGLPPEPTRVAVGYVLDATATQVKRVQISRPNGNGVDWCAAIVPLNERDQELSMWEDVTRQLRLTRIA